MSGPTLEQALALAAKYKAVADRVIKERDDLRSQLVTANKEIEALKHDLERHIQIASDALTRNEGKP